MDEQTIKEISLEVQAIVSKFLRCFKEEDKTNSSSSNQFQRIIDELGWITIDHNGVEECLGLLNDNYHEATSISDAAIRKALIKCISLVATPMIYAYQKGSRMDKAGCGDIIAMHMFSATNLCYFIQKKFVEHENVQLVVLFEPDRPYMAMLPNAWTGKAEPNICQAVAVVAVDGKVEIEAWSRLFLKHKEKLTIITKNDLEAFSLEEDAEGFTYTSYPRFFDDESFGL